MKELKPEQLIVSSMGKPTIKSPLALSTIDGDFLANYIPDDERVLVSTSLKQMQVCLKAGHDPLSFERAGPREQIYFNPAQTKAAIVTCGGLCPGINDVIRGLVMTLSWGYNIKSIYGFRYGYLGMVKDSNLQPIVLDQDMVSDIHEKGGTILGSSRGPQDVSKMVDRLMDFGINILFTIGGDGTLHGSKEIANEVRKRGMPMSVIGIPKTIDNDINFIEKTFGFETAFSIAVDSIRCAHTEAKGAQNGIGLVKLMGRDSGYIAANAAIASQDVNFCLIPEVPFDLEGPNGLYAHLQKRLQTRGHAVIVVAEGAGQKFVTNTGKDASGNAKLGDVGTFLRDAIREHFNKLNFPMGIRYIDPSYIVRSAPAIPSDSIYCTQLAQSAAHAGMAGKTDMLVGIWNNQFIHLPLSLAISGRKVIDPESIFWLNVLEATGQPSNMVNK